MVRNIGCFITGGWTEAGAMSVFLKKINSNFEYVQCLPNKPKYKIGLDEKSSGLTGESLISEIYRRMELFKDEYCKFSAIIVEDDLDCRFQGKSDTEIIEYKDCICKRVTSILEKPIPIFFLYASPEIEVWFLCDWNNSFVKVYNDQFFCHRLKSYIDKSVVKEYWKIGIENYSGRKISDEIINAVANGVKDEIQKEYEYKSIPENIRKILDDRGLYYSKKIHGDMMLKNINPEDLLEKCKVYFSPCYYSLNRFE